MKSAVDLLSLRLDAAPAIVRANQQIRDLAKQLTYANAYGSPADGMFGPAPRLSMELDVETKADAQPDLERSGNTNWKPGLAAPPWIRARPRSEIAGGIPCQRMSRARRRSRARMQASR